MKTLSDPKNKDADLRNLCPLWPETQQVMTNALTLERSLKDLRKKMDACDLCVHNDSCPILTDLKKTISKAIHDVNVELGIIKS